jgi:UDP-hydrolysing UDP-N-acetyl-D-glucosamine 2-epimerase
MALVDRANWGRCQPVAEAIRAHRDLELTILCGGSTPLDRFKNPAAQIERQGYEVECFYHEVEGSIPVSAARSGGLAQMDYAAALDRIHPDVVYVIGDRYQALGVAAAAVTLGIPLVHQQGGEVSGALDERYRHAITKLADYHVPATVRARQNIIRMGEREESILAVGCPSADLAEKIAPTRGNYILSVFHPDTANAKAVAEVNELLAALHSTGKRVVYLWPNIDFGSSAVSKAIRTFRSVWKLDWEFVTHVEPEHYLTLLANASCAVGNSSSFVCREGGNV